MEDRDSKGRFLPGFVGNPRGRPRKKPTAEEIFGSVAMEAATELIDLIHSDDKAVAIRACIAILDFALREDRKSKHLTQPKKDSSIQEFQAGWDRMAETVRRYANAKPDDDGIWNWKFIDVTPDKS